MNNTNVNNKAIARNSLFLYVRMLFIMVVNLYAVRAILDILGVVDYGIYNVIGGVIAMFSFLNGTLATSSQRYFSIAIAEGNNQKLSNVFKLNLSVFFIFIITVAAIAETVGLWYVNRIMTIPDNRLFAANVVYQFTIITFAMQMISVPYNALMIAHEQMKTFAFIGGAEALFKLLIVFLLFNINTDKLILYAFLSMLSGLFVFITYALFCRKHYPESRYRLYWDKTLAVDMVSFSSWHFLGTISVAVRSQGINLLINVFFSPAVNAARAIAFQVNSAVNQLAGNFFVAVKPQMYKAYANQKIDQLILLINRSTAICIYLVSILAIPFIVNAEYILSLWLKDVPQYAVIFTQLVLINSIVDATSNPTICAALATKRIKVFYLITGTLYIMCLPISYIALKIGYDASVTMLVSISISITCIISRAFLLKPLIQFPVKSYLIFVLKLFAVSIVAYFATTQVADYFKPSFKATCLSALFSILTHTCLYYLFVLSGTDREYLKVFIKNKIRK